MAELYFILYFYSVIKYITLIMFYQAFYTDVVTVFNVFVFILVCSCLFIHFNYVFFFFILLLYL